MRGHAQLKREKFHVTLTLTVLQFHLLQFLPEVKLHKVGGLIFAISNQNEKSAMIGGQHTLKDKTGRTGHLRTTCFDDKPLKTTNLWRIAL
jgi:hypothetical protein